MFYTFIKRNVFVNCASVPKNPQAKTGTKYSLTELMDMNPCGYFNILLLAFKTDQTAVDIKQSL